MAWTTDCLGYAETQLGVLTRGDQRKTLDRWRDACTELAGAGITHPSQLRGWLRQRPTQLADEVLRGLVKLAQRGDTVALLAVLVCLAPGIRSLARQTGVSADEAMSEVTLGILEYPYARRRSVAGGLLLDARNRITRGARRTPEPTDLVDHAEQAGQGYPSATSEPTTAERILALICEARRRNILDQDEAQLIVDTRLSGQRVAPAAARLGISPEAAYQRRTRAERRISAHFGSG